MNSKRGLLMRVGIDQTYGKYNAPINPETGDYLYMPIPQEGHEFRSGMLTSYDAMVAKFDIWNSSNKTTLEFPPHLIGKSCHLDPDFEYLTYGDQATGRGYQVRELKEGDFLVFFASFKPVRPCEHKLIYALYGMITVDSVKRVSELGMTDFHKNAHTRISDPNMDHLIVFGKKEFSGRFKKAIPIGEFRNSSYRVTNSVLSAWGGLGVKDGFIQRSVCPPWFDDASKFLEWLSFERGEFIQSNW